MLHFLECNCTLNLVPGTLEIAFWGFLISKFSFSKAFTDNFGGRNWASLHSRHWLFFFLRLREESMQSGEEAPAVKALVFCSLAACRMLWPRMPPGS